MLKAVYQMKKQEVPKIVVETLKIISSLIKEFNNDESHFKLVAKSSDDFLLKIYPKNNDLVFFQIDRKSVV